MANRDMPQCLRLVSRRARAAMAPWLLTHGLGDLVGHIFVFVDYNWDDLLPEWYVAFGRATRRPLYMQVLTANPLVPAEHVGRIFACIMPHEEALVDAVVGQVEDVGGQLAVRWDTFQPSPLHTAGDHEPDIVLGAVFDADAWFDAVRAAPFTLRAHTLTNRIFIRAGALFLRGLFEQQLVGADDVATRNLQEAIDGLMAQIRVCEHSLRMP
jgi:hypothetical protein